MQTGACTTALIYRAHDHPLGAVLVLGHGAGAGQRSAWIVSFARALADRGLDVVTFNFLYTEHGRKIPDRQPLLESCYAAVIESVRSGPARGRALFIGGKSMGGRIATHVAARADELGICGVVLLGYPLHPPGRPEQRRDAHLPHVKCPMLFVQGSRDTFGTRQELEPVLATLRPRPTLHVVEGGDHSFKATKVAARQAALMTAAQDGVAAWITSTMDGR